MDIMTNLDHGDELDGCKNSIETSSKELKLINDMWEFIKRSQSLLETFKETSWNNIDGQSMDEKISSSLTKENN